MTYNAGEHKSTGINVPVTIETQLGGITNLLLQLLERVSISNTTLSDLNSRLALLNGTMSELNTSIRELCDETRLKVTFPGSYARKSPVSTLNQLHDDDFQRIYEHINANTRFPSHELAEWINQLQKDVRSGDIYDQ